MNPDSPFFPGRVLAEEAAKMLGFPTHAMPVLVRHKLLRPLGKPAPNAPKYFASCDILQKKVDVKWLDQATVVMAAFWRSKKNRPPANSSEE
jgi:hypothetical protein